MKLIIMKTKLYSILIALSIVFTSCSRDENQPELELVNIVTPEFMTLEAFRSSVKVSEPREIIESGKIFSYQNYILVNDVDKGIHIIDNTNPTAPVKKYFIEIIGNKDMEVRDDFLYADSLTDLVVFNIADFNNIEEASRIEEVFFNSIDVPFVDNIVFNNEAFNNNEDMILVGWEVIQGFREIQENPDVFIDEAIALSSDNVSSGEGGSLARFKIVDDFLYVVDNFDINVFDVSNLENPEALDDVPVGFGIETIFNRGDYLFLGSTNGMFIYDITSADKPTFVSEFTHATFCDPVVVDDRYAYIT